MAKLRETIAELEAILGDPAKLRAVISEELTEIKNKYADPRRTRHPRPGRDGGRGPHRGRGARRHHDPGRVHQGRHGCVRSAPRVAVGAASRVPG